MDGFDIMAGIVQRAEQIERDKNGLALTEDEAQTLKAAAFLRIIAPYAFADPKPAVVRTGEDA